MHRVAARTPCAAVPLRFQIGARTLLSVSRRLVRVPLSLDEALCGKAPTLPPLPADAHGYLVTSLPVDARLTAPGLRAWERQRYTRYFTALTPGFDAWEAQLSAKTRATLRRKERRFADAGGGPIDVHVARTPAEIARFFEDARAVSAISYQERLLDAGLPARAEPMLALAAGDAVRGFLLYLAGRPVSYLYLPAEGDTLRYARLGYDPAVAALSPGTVLQLAALRMLMAEARFARLDFTEGEGQHKRLFASDGIACRDVMLLRRTIGNWGVSSGLQAFDAAVAQAKRAAAHPRLAGWAARVRR